LAYRANLSCLCAIFVVALSLIGITTFLPRGPRDKLVALVEDLERRTGLTAILLLGLIIYWLARLLYMREAFMKLIAG